MYREAAVQMLTRPTAGMAPFTEEEARQMVQHMHPYTIPAGERFLVEKEGNGNDFMMLILSGVVVVESQIADGYTLTVNVLQPGSWVGELGLLDGLPRQADCRASDDDEVVCAIISRSQLLAMLETTPHLVAKMALLLAANVATSLRDMHQKMCRYAEIQNAIRTSL